MRLAFSFLCLNLERCSPYQAPDGAQMRCFSIITTGTSCLCYSRTGIPIPAILRQCLDISTWILGAIFPEKLGERSHSGSVPRLFHGCLGSVRSLWRVGTRRLGTRECWHGV